MLVWAFKRPYVIGRQTRKKATLMFLLIGPIRNIGVQQQLIKARKNLDDSLKLENEKSSEKIGETSEATST